MQEKFRGFKNKEINFKNSIIRICFEEKENPLLGIIQASRIFFVSYENLRFKGKIKEKRNFFLNGNFRGKIGRIFAVSGQNKQIDLLDVSKKKILRSLKGHNGPVYSTSFSDDGLTLISGGNDMVLKSWDISLEKCIFSYPSHEDFIRTVCFFPRSNQICGTSSYDGKIKIQDLRVKEPIVKIFDHGCPVESFKFFPEQKTMVSIGGNYLKFWNMSGNKCFFQIKEPKPLLNLSIFSEKAVLYNQLGQELVLCDYSDLKTYPLLSFKKEILTFETCQKSILVGFSNGKICCQSLVRTLGKINETKFKNFPGFSCFSKPQKIRPFLGFRKKNSKFSSKIFYLQKKKKVFIKNKKKIKFNKLPPAPLKSISFILQRNWKQLANDSTIYRESLYVNKKDFLNNTNNQDFLKILSHLNIQKVFSLIQSIELKIPTNNQYELFFLNKLLTTDLIFSNFLKKKFYPKLVLDIFQKRKKFERILAFRSLCKKKLSEEV